jgi:polysaccharide biosynthesis transport protein
VTSTSRGEGTSLLAFQLAMAFAAAGRRTLLIDANTLNPTLSTVLAPVAKGAEEDGLIQALRDGSIDGIMLPPSGRLFFMPIGRERQGTHMSDLVEAAEARGLFESLRARFDRVVIDLPPFSALPDAWAFGLNLDSYVLVIAAGRTRQHEAAQMVGLLAASSASIAGAVLNTRKR